MELPCSFQNKLTSSPSPSPEPAGSSWSKHFAMSHSEPSRRRDSDCCLGDSPELENMSFFLAVPKAAFTAQERRKPNERSNKQKLKKTKSQAPFFSLKRVYLGVSFKKAYTIVLW